MCILADLRRRINCSANLLFDDICEPRNSSIKLITR